MARDLLRRHLRERFQVTMLSGESFDGLLDEWDGQHLTLLDAGVVNENGQRVPVPGEVWLPRDRVAYMHRPQR